MKKSELTRLTQIIECIVTKEIRKQLPIIMTEALRDMSSKLNITECKKNTIVDSKINEDVDGLSENSNNLKTSLKELFSGKSVIENDEVNQPKILKRFAKDPILNQILNETISDLRYKDRSVGGAALVAGYSPFDAEINSNPVDLGNIMPSMNSSNKTIANMSDTHIPLESLPKDLSVLDMTQYAPPLVQKALTRNYSDMMKMIDKKKGKL